MDSPKKKVTSILWLIQLNSFGDSSTCVCLFCRNPVTMQKMSVYITKSLYERSQQELKDLAEKHKQVLKMSLHSLDFNTCVVFINLLETVFILFHNVWSIWTFIGNDVHHDSFETSVKTWGKPVNKQLVQALYGYVESCMHAKFARKKRKSRLRRKPRATLTFLCSPNFPSAAITQYIHSSEHESVILSQQSDNIVGTKTCFICDWLTTKCAQCMLKNCRQCRQTKSKILGENVDKQSKNLQV